MADQSIVNRILAIGRRRRVPKTVIKSALETGRIESNFENLPGGDADSQGWRQERASLYKNPRNVDASINRFYDEALAETQRRPGEHSWDIAANVQRPAAQYRGRYRTAAGEANRLLGIGQGGAPRRPSTGVPGTSPGLPDASSASAASTASTEAAGDYRRNLLTQYLQGRDSNPDALLELAIGLHNQPKAAATMVPAAQVTKDAVKHPNDPVAALAAEADRIDSARVPYQWGGGHQGKQKRGSKVTPLDCSGAVSRVLGINPKVSGQFAQWGKPGEGKRVTIYANSTHVIMKIDGHFFGTSNANPGGGAGWIPAKWITKQYLSRFTKRHPAGM